MEPNWTLAWISVLLPQAGLANEFSTTLDCNLWEGLGWLHSQSPTKSIPRTVKQSQVQFIVQVLTGHYSKHIFWFLHFSSCWYWVSRCVYFLLFKISHYIFGISVSFPAAISSFVLRRKTAWGCLSFLPVLVKLNRMKQIFIYGII